MYSQQWTMLGQHWASTQSAFRGQSTNIQSAYCCNTCQHWPSISQHSAIIQSVLTSIHASLDSTQPTPTHNLSLILLRFRFILILLLFSLILIVMLVYFMWLRWFVCFGRQLIMVLMQLVLILRWEIINLGWYIWLRSLKHIPVCCLGDTAASWRWLPSDVSGGILRIPILTSRMMGIVVVVLLHLLTHLVIRPPYL